MSVNLAPVALSRTTVTVAPTETELAIFDTRYTEVLTVQIENSTGDGQTFSGTVYRRLTEADAWAPSNLADFSPIADGASVVADMDTRGTGFIRIMGSCSGAGGDINISARRRAV